MEHILNDDTLPMFVEFAKNVWGFSGDDDYALAHAGIDALKKFFFETMGIPANLRAVGITDDRNFEVMAKKACEGSKDRLYRLARTILWRFTERHSNQSFLQIGGLIP